MPPLPSPPRADGPAGQHLEADELITLNADLDLSRALVCRLAAADLPWWRDTEAAAQRLGVRRESLDAARKTLAATRRVAAGERRRANRLGAHIVTLRDTDYPAMLFDLALPPPVLYVRGALPARPGVAIVGARRASAYGRDVATAFAGELAERGLTVISGFARGIDAAAHRAALVAPGGTTVAVLGCGLDVDYPRGRRAERRQIAERGALVTEFPFAAAPQAYNFPVRNRIIAALGTGTLVVEATARSGSLITARLALELGRLIWAVPGRIFDPRALGPNALIRDGAFLVQHPRDVVLTLPQEIVDRLDVEGGNAAPAPHLPQPARTVLEAIAPGERVTVETLHDRTATALPELLAALLELEMGGWVRRHPGPAYGRAELW
jgi:DNA processing protein